MTLLTRLALFLAILALSFAAVPCPAGEVPPNIIFDTDMGGDCDDVGALFIVHGAIERGEAKLIATMGCTSSDAIAPCLDAINTWFGRPEIPVGTLKDLGFHADPGYPGELIRRYPHKFPSGKDYPDAVVLYRQILAKQPDGSVLVVAVGMLRNLANLLKSGPDPVSPLEGRALVAMKVKRLVVMGGKYPPFASRNDKDGEYNFVQDAPSTALVCATWPTPILFNGEGGSTNSGRRVTFELPEHNPLSMAYRCYPNVGYAGDRLSWDPITALVTVRGAAPWFRVVSDGVNVADDKTGVNKWQEGADRGHSYLVAQSPKADTETALEDMMVAGKGRPTNLVFNTAYYANAGMCQITTQGGVDANAAGINAFDGDDRTAWLDKAATSWIQCQYVDGRKYLVTSYVVTCKEPQRLPRTLELTGSNDGGATWTSLDFQSLPGFTGETTRREFAIAKPAKWNIYRLELTAAKENEGLQINEIALNEAITCTPKLAVASVTIDHKSLTIPTHGRATLNATLAPINTFEREVVWVSSDPSVADVRRIGEQIAMVVGKKPGTCMVSATVDKVKETCAVTVAASTLPAGWSFDELNAPAIPGAVEVANGAFTLTGCGHAMTSFWQRVRDQGTFVNRPVTGDAAISVRLTTLAPNVGGPAYQWDTRPPSVSGLMIREKLSETCGRYVLIQIDAAGNLSCRWRDKSGDADDNNKKDFGKVTLPIHLKLVQAGKDIQVFTSIDGTDWGEPRLTHTAAAFGNKSHIGMFVCSGNTFATTTARFDIVTLGQ